MHRFADGLREVTGGQEVWLSAKSGADEIAAAVERIRAARRVVVAFDVRSSNLPASARAVFEVLTPEQQVIAGSFGDTFVMALLPHAHVWLCAFCATPHTERLAAQVLLGRAPVSGKLPVTVPGVAAAGTGLLQLPGTDVPVVAPAEQDVAGDLSERLREVLQRAIVDGAFPGAVCAVARRGERIAEVAVGRFGYAEDEPPVAPSTVYDLASLTKACATAPSVLVLAARGALSLGDPVVKWVPEFTGEGKQAVTVRDLLQHTSGLPAGAPLFRKGHGAEVILAAAAATPLAQATGETVYSDLGYMLLMRVVEQASGEPFAAFAQREVFHRLGMSHAGFWPNDGPAADAAPTETGRESGRVHDENAFAMGGVSGHAGLFGTADDVQRLGIAMLAGGRGLLPRELAAEATSARQPGDHYGLGFRMLQSGGWAGSQVPPGTFGHTGFTGTSLWCDPSHDLCVVLLTNRVHPTRDNGKIQAVRAAVHDLVLASLR
jgi:CubicO group peptidase (beta-lactamase class C family)